MCRLYTDRLLLFIGILTFFFCQGGGGLSFALEVETKELVSPREAQSAAKSIAHYIKGLMYDWDGETKQAIAEYEEAAKSDREVSLIHLRIGSNYARLGQFTEAIRELKLASELNPDDQQPHYILALIYTAQQDFNQAAAEYELILQYLAKTDPQNTEVYIYLGQLYYSQRKLDKAIEQFQHILTFQPQNADAMFMLGSLYLENDDRPKAMELFKKSLDVNPNHDASLNSLGYMYAEDGVNLDEALNLVKKALEFSAKNGAYLDSLGWVYFKKGMMDEALEYLKQAVNLFKDPVIYDHLGDVYYRVGQELDAEKYWQQSLDLLPNQERILKKLDALKKGEQITP